MKKLNTKTCIGRYIHNKEGQTGELTRENYLNELDLFVRYMNENLYENGEFTERITIDNFDKFLDKMTIRMVDDYKFFLKENSLEDTSIKKKITIIKNFVSFLFKKEYISKDFSGDIANVKVSEKEVIALDVEEFDLLLEKLGTFKDREAARDELMLKMILVHGFRSFEIRNIQISNLDFETGLLKFKAKRDFGIEMSEMYIHPKFVEMIKKYIAVNRVEGKEGYEDILFTNRLGRVLSTQGLIDIVKKRLRMSGIAEETVSVITTHKLRSSFVTYLALTNDGTLTTFDIQRLARHKSATTTSRYVKVSEKRKAEITNNVFGGKI